MDLIQVDTGVVCPPSPSAHAGEWQAEAADAGQFYCVRTPYQAIQETNGKNGTTTYAPWSCMLIRFKLLTPLLCISSTI